MMDFTSTWRPWQKALAQKHGLTCPPGWYGFACGPGWEHLLDEAFTKMRALGWDGEIHQVKEKFGTLRLYTTGVHKDKADEFFKIIRAAEAKSEHTCESCGLRGKLRANDWWRTLCDACEVLREQEQKEREMAWEEKRKKMENG